MLSLLVRGGSEVGVDRGSLHAHASDNQVCFQVVADQAAVAPLLVDELGRLMAIWCAMVCIAASLCSAQEGEVLEEQTSSACVAASKGDSG